MAPCVLLLLLFLCEAASAEDVTSVNHGDDVILPCRSADPNIRAVQWTRTDLKSEYVLFYSGRHLQPKKQHESFQGRVQLVDRDLKNRDLSLILKNVKSSDEGTYECRAVDDSTQQKIAITKTEPIRRIRLHVTDETKSLRPGDDVTLPCRSADPNITAVEWTRTDLKSLQYVLYHSDGYSDPAHQHSSFQGRVQLVDRDLKDGDVSLTLKDIKSSDEGTYECRVRVGGSTRQRRAVIDDQPIIRVRLQVPGSDHGEKKDGGRTGLVNGILGFFIFVLAIVAAVFGFLEIKTKLKKHRNSS